MHTKLNFSLGANDISFAGKRSGLISIVCAYLNWRSSLERSEVWVKEQYIVIDGFRTEQERVGFLYGS
jgi:hypothetical protein